MKRSDKQTFEDNSDIIDAAIKKQKNKWQLNAINWFDFEDVEQIIKIHINKKWDMWDQDRPLEPWIGRIISNQIRNLVRNHYGNYVRPCIKCQFNMGDNTCSATRTGIQDNQCKLYDKWSHQKKAGLDLKITVSTENHINEISSRPDNDFSYDLSVRKLNEHMIAQLSVIHYQAYLMLFFQDCSEEEVAEFMGYKTNEKKRKAGYRQVKNLKSTFQKKAEEIIKNFDIIINETD
jgi:DNA-directed RNA polymerase specialized sigma24 family protein